MILRAVEGETTSERMFIYEAAVDILVDAVGVMEVDPMMVGRFNSGQLSVLSRLEQLKGACERYVRKLPESGASEGEEMKTSRCLSQVKAVVEKMHVSMLVSVAPRWTERNTVRRPARRTLEDPRHGYYQHAGMK